MIAGMVCVSVTHPTSQVKKFLEHSQLVERCGRFRKDLEVEASGSTRLLPARLLHIYCIEECSV
jgi:hypothetical protein